MICARVDTSIANELSGAAWEQMINPLLEWIVSQTADSDTLCTMLVRPYLYNFKTKAWQSVAWCLKYIDALKLMFKMAMFLKSRDEFSSFARSRKSMGATFTFRRYTRGWYSNGGRLLRWRCRGLTSARCLFARSR